MITKFVKILIISNLIYLSSFGQKYDFVKILPGYGIVYNNDSILLHKTNIKKLCKILNIVDSKPDELLIRCWDGYNPETRKDTSGTEYVREIKFKTILFEFANDKDDKNLILRWIRAKEGKSLKIYTDNGLEIGGINPKIREIYSELKKQDYVSDNELTYNLYSYGISFQLVKLLNNDLKLIEISTHYTSK